MDDTIKAFEDMEKKAKELIPDFTALPVMGGVYYTTPAEVENEEDNKWSSFFILDDAPELMEAAKKLPKSDVYNVVTIPKCRVLYASFPYRNNISYLFGPLKVNDAMQNEINKHDVKPVASVELYHKNGEPLEYLTYLEGDDAFKEIQRTSFIAANKL